MNTAIHTTSVAPLIWQVRAASDYTMAEFSITAPDGILDPADLARIDVPKEAPKNKGIIFNGRGPVWLYGHLVHRAHPYCWVGIFDPRLHAAVVIERHTVSAPKLGQTIITAETED